MMQEAGIGVALIIAVGFALLARLLFKPKPGAIIKDSKPNSPTQRGAFIPLVIGQRKVGAVIAFVGDRRTTQEEVPGGGKGFGGDSPTQTIYHEKGIHLLCVGPASAISGIFADGKRIPGSENITNVTHPSGTSITFPKFGTMRIYWGGKTNHPLEDALLDGKLGIATKGPYVCRVEWDDYRLGVQQTWPILEYIITVAPCAPTDLIAVPELEDGINPGLVMHQLAVAKYPHGAGTPVEWWDVSTFVDIADLAVNEAVSMNILVEEGDSADRIIANVMSDMGFMLSECAGILHLVPMRQFTDPVETLDNDILLPPIESIEKVHISTLGDALVYSYIDKAQNYRNGTIDVDDDSVGAIRNQRKTKTIKLETITIRDVASRIANRRQVEDFDPPTGVKAQGLRGLRAATVGQPFDLPGVGRMRLVGWKLEWKEPTVSLDLIKDPWDQAIIPFVDPSLPGGAGSGPLLPDIRFDGFEVPAFVTGGETNAIIVFRHRDNSSLTFSNIHVSRDDITYEALGTQNIACAGGVLDADWDADKLMPIIEDGPLINIDPNGDEDRPVNLSGVLQSWYTGSQLMMIGSGQDAELFYLRQWDEVVEGVSFRPKGLIRNIAGTGYRTLTKFDENPYKTFLAGTPCYIINQAALTPVVGETVNLNGVRFLKSTPGNSDGTIPSGAVIADELEQKSLGTVNPQITWVTYGGTFGTTDGTHRRDKSYKHDPIDPANNDPDVLEGIGITFMPGVVPQGAGFQGFGQPVEVGVAQGNYRLEMYFNEDGQGFDDMELITTLTGTIASLIQNDDGSKTLIVPRATLDTFVDDATGIPLLQFGPMQDRETGGVEADHIWKWLLYHIDGTEGDPVEIRPHMIQVQDYQWIPMVKP